MLAQDSDFEDDTLSIGSQEEVIELNEDHGIGEEEEAAMHDDAIAMIHAHSDSVYCIDTHPVIPYVVVSGGGDDKASLWRIDLAEKIVDLATHGDSVSAVAFSHNGEYVASGGLDGNVSVFLSISAQLVALMDGPSEVTWMDWHPNGPVLLAGSADGTIWMWNVVKKVCMSVFSGHSDAVTCGGFTPDGKHIVSGSADGSVLVWDPKTAAVLFRFNSGGLFHEGSIGALAIHPDNQLVLTGSDDGTARLIQIATGKILAKLEQHLDSVEAVAFCPTMPLGVTTDIEGKINIWDINTLSLRQSCNHEEAVTKIKFLSNSPIFITSSMDKTVRLWDVRTGENLRTWYGHEDAILDISITGDGKKIVSCADDGTLRVYSLETL